jgi:hypothetical protein
VKKVSFIETQNWQREGSGFMSPTAGSKSVNLLVLALCSLIAGAAAGLLVAGLRLALQRADRFRDTAPHWGHSEGLVGFFAILGVSAIATALAA